MIRTLPVQGHVMWLYGRPTTDAFPPFDTVCTIDYSAPDGVPFIRGMSGNRFYPRFVSEMASWFDTQGSATVRASRAEGHRLPGGIWKPEVGYYEWDIKALLERLRR